MSDVVARAKAALDSSSCPCGERECNRPNPRQLARLVPELVAEIERLRSYKSLPPGMVWQDYYSPNEVLAIREPLDDEIERLKTWDGLLSILDEFYPESIFPTGDDRADRDSGPRIVSLIRQLDRLRAAAEGREEKP